MSQNSEIRQDVVDSLIRKILTLENQNLFNKNMSDRQIKEQIVKWIKEEVNVNRID